MIPDADFEDVVEAVAQLVDLAGVAVIAVGLLVATAMSGPSLVRSVSRGAAFRSYRQRVGKAILLGLEFLVAADILRTVAVSPTFRGVGVLAVIVVIRTFLSFTLEVELEGRWPWQKHLDRPA